MALPFFRKDRSKPEPEPVKTGSKPRTTTLSPGLTAYGVNAPANQGIVVEESGNMDSSAGEAAILYASAQISQVETMLRGMLAENSIEAWHMLFDLYRLNRRQAEFDRLGLDYAMRFESSPPAWQAGAEGSKAKKKETARPLVVPSIVEDNIGEKLDNFLFSLEKNATLQLDFSKVAEVTPEGAQHIANMLAASHKRKFKFQVSGAGGMVDMLRSRMHANPDIQSYWLMLMALYQLLGKQTEFEDMALDFAMTFELSPPSWETSVQAAQEVAAPEPEMPGNAFVLSGEIGEASHAQIDALLKYAQEHAEVVIDCSGLVRMEYGYVGTWIGHLMQMLGNGRTVTLQGQNSLVNALFVTMGIDQIATLIPAKLV